MPDARKMGYGAEIRTYCGKYTNESFGAWSVGSASLEHINRKKGLHSDRFNKSQHLYRSQGKADATRSGNLKKLKKDEMELLGAFQ